MVGRTTLTFSKKKEKFETNTGFKPDYATYCYKFHGLAMREGVRMAYWEECEFLYIYQT
jgi:hypothetical protein